MQIVYDTLTSFPRKEVWDTYRDRLPELLPYLPSIRGVEVTERTEAGNVVTLTTSWRAGGDIPAIARALLSESVISWTGLTAWREEAWECDWQTRTHVFAEAFRCSGVNRFVEVAGGTRLEIRGDLTVDAAKIGLLPRRVAGTFERVVEEFLIRMIGRNLLDVSAGVERWLKDHKGFGFAGRAASAASSAERSK